VGGHPSRSCHDKMKEKKEKKKKKKKRF